MFRIAICDDEKDFGNKLNEKVKTICIKNSIEYKSNIYSDGLSLIEWKEFLRKMEIINNYGKNAVLVWIYKRLCDMLCLH
ncbi:MAG: hypothetical protein IJ932_05205 [Ruminococcus sp.]|nr:hypothetical protein [Ruminococcus sp.]